MNKILALALTASMAISLAACGNATLSNEKSETNKEVNKEVEKTQPGEEEQPVTITFCNFNAAGGKEEVLASMYKEFQKEFPNIKVEIETVGYDDYFTQMQTRVASGTAPDCYELNIENFAAYLS